PSPGGPGGEPRSKSREDTGGGHRRKFSRYRGELRGIAGPTDTKGRSTPLASAGPFPLPLFGLLALPVRSACVGEGRRTLHRVVTDEDRPRHLVLLVPHLDRGPVVGLGHDLLGDTHRQRAV